MKQIFVIAVVIFCCHTALAQQAYSGFVHDATTGEVLIGVTVFTANKKMERQQTHTDILIFMLTSLIHYFFSTWVIQLQL